MGGLEDGMGGLDRPETFGEVLAKSLLWAVVFAEVLVVYGVRPLGLDLRHVLTFWGL